MQELSVIRISTYSLPYLNRQVILLLSYLGVKDQLFKERNEKAIEFLDIKKTLTRLSFKALDLRNKTEDNPKELVKEMKLFFGPSR